MHITLIKPKIGHKKDGPYVDEGSMEPLMLGVLAGLTPEHHEVVLWDDRFEEIPFDKPTDLVAITVETFTARRAYEISREYRSRGVKVVMGGMHATLIPQEVSGHCDSLLRGDAESAWTDLLLDLEADSLKEQYHGKPGPPQNHRPVNRRIFLGKPYLPVQLIQFSRGCPNQCTYCATSAFFDHSHYTRPAEEVIEEMGQNRVFFFVDDNFAANREATKDLLRRMIPLKVRWVSQMSLDVAMDKELLQLMEKSGCLGFVVGFESINAQNVGWMNKNNVNLGVAQAYQEQITRLKDHGFQIWAAFTIGHDFDTRSSIEDTVDFALKHRFTFAAFNVLLPYPGTPLYQRLKEEDRLLYDGCWWLHPDYRFNYAALRPKGLTAHELTQAGMEARRRFNTFPSILRRAMDLKTNLRSIPKFLYFARYSLLFKREVKKKESMIFGGGS